MRYAIFSDIHANNQAWEATLADILTNQCEVLVCLGDAVGYGPRPYEVLTSIRQHSHAFVLGNHDAAACGRLDSSYFNENAQAGIAHTRALLDQESIDFLAGVPYATESGDLLFVHAEVAYPDRFDYVESVEKACEDFAASQHRCTFIGHTHHPCVFVMGEDGLVGLEADEDFQFAHAQRYIVNVGSVGEPRNPEDIRARYVIYDEEAHTVYFRRIEFDAEAYRADLKASGSSAFPYFLQILDHQLETEQSFVHAMNAPAATTGAGIQIAKMELPTMSQVREASRQATKKSAKSTFLILGLVVGSIALGWLGKWFFDPQRRDVARDPLGLEGAPPPQIEASGVPMAEALFGYWPLDAETRGYAGRAPFQGLGVGKPDRAEGKFGGGIHLDAASGLVFGKDRTYAIRDGALSVSFWVQLTDPPRTEIRLLGNGARTKEDPGFLITLQGSVLKFLLGSGVTRAQLGGLRPSIRDGAWHHVAAVFDAESGMLRAYFDGNDLGELDIATLGGNFPAAHRLRIGNAGGAAGLSGPGGNVDELAVWQRALTGEEIEAMFENGVPLAQMLGGKEDSAD